jgi:hypothetical protein
MFNNPAADVEVPVGIYTRQLVLLQRAEGTNVAVGLGTNRLAVTATNEARLDAGGPLRNRVEIGRAPRIAVTLHYRLANAAGIGFHLAIRHRKAPRVVIRQANAVVGQGQFEFG